MSELTRLPLEPQAALQQLACLGNVRDHDAFARSREIERRCPFDLGRLRLELSSPEARTSSSTPGAGAALFIISTVARRAPPAIGRLLAAHTSAEKRESPSANRQSLNRGVALITSPDEREQR